MGKGRKKREDVWKNYRIGSDKSVICTFCENKYKVANVNKMHNHLLKCYKCPEVIKNELRKQNNQTTERISNTTDTSTPLYSENSQSEHLLIQPSTSLIQPDLCVIQPSTSAFQPYLSLTQSSPAASAAAQTSCQSLEEESVKRLTKKFARAVFVSGSPLSLVEHPLWIDFFKDLQPSFKLPSRKNLSESLLDNVHTEIKKEVTENLKQTSYLHLQCDGWTNVNNEGIINFVISNPEPYFVESLSTEENKHTSLYLSQEIIKVMRCYGETKFIVLIGDNARNIQKAFELVKMKYPYIVPLNCTAHTLNLLIHDILKCEVIKGFIDLATDIIKTIKKSQGLSSLLNKIVKEKKLGRH